MADFSISIDPTLRREGFYSNRKADRGGETYAGITRKDNPAWPGWAAIDAAKPLKQNERVLAADIHVHAWYRAHYWNAVKGDLVTDQRVAGFLFDWYVNSGYWAVINLQYLLGVNADGRLGPKTLAALNAYPSDALFHELKGARKVFVSRIAANDKSQDENLEGWMNRIRDFE